MANSLNAHIKIRKFEEYKRRIREGRKVERLVGDTGNDTHNLLTSREGHGTAGAPIPQTRIIPDESRLVGPAAGGVPRTRIFNSGGIEAPRNESFDGGVIQRVGTLDIGKILGDQNVFNIRLGDKIEVDGENFGEPPPIWYEIAAQYTQTIFPEHVTIHPEFSIAHPKVWNDGNGNWYYNFPGAVLLSAATGRRLPTAKQLDLAIRANPELFQQGSGYYDPSNTVIGTSEMRFLHGLGSASHFWTATYDLSSGNTATSLILKTGDSDPYENSINRRLFLPVRLIIEMPDEHYLGSEATSTIEES